MVCLYNVCIIFILVTLILTLGHCSDVTTIVLLGQTGVGKSSLANVLLGYGEANTQYENEGCFSVSSSFDNMTRKPCIKRGKFLGNGEDINIVDTPGFSSAYDNGTFSEMVHFLRKEVDHVNMFAILWQATDYRFTYDHQQMLLVLHKGFGEQFWNNVVYIVTKWSMHSRNIAMRLQQVPPLTKDLMTTTLIQRTQRLLQIKQSPNVYFLDTFFNKHAFDEKSNFDNEVYSFFSHAKKKKPYQTSHSEVAYNEIESLKKQFEEADRLVKLMNSNITVELENKKLLTKMIKQVGHNIFDTIATNKGKLDVLEVILMLVLCLAAIMGGFIVFYHLKSILEGFPCFKKTHRKIKDKLKKPSRITEEEFDDNFL